MRSTCVAVLALLVACGGHTGVTPDGSVPEDGSVPDAPDAPIDTSDGIAAARAAHAATGLMLPIRGVTVTSVRPLVGDTRPTLGGFTIQAQQQGGALFVAIDPTTLTPPLHVGDVVSFTITGIEGYIPSRVSALTDLTVIQTGTDVTPLVQDASSWTTLHSFSETNFNGHDGEVVSLTGTVASNPGSAFYFPGFEEIALDTAGVQNAHFLVARFPLALSSGFDGAIGCHITIFKAPIIVYYFAPEGGAFRDELGLYDTSDYTLTDCPAPKVHLAVAPSPTSVKLVFDREIKASSVMADGSQFTFDHGLTASAATVSGDTIRVITSAQSPNTSYTLTVANSVTDLHGTGVAAGTTFPGFVTPAIVRINEIKNTGSHGCDLIELRVVQGGPMTGFTITAVSEGVPDLSLTFTSFIVRTNDLIVVHAEDDPSCNPGTSMNEAVAVTDQPTAMFAANFDTAYDWYTRSYMTRTQAVITLTDAADSILDAVFLTSPGSVLFPAPLNAAGVVGAANQWMPAQASYEPATFHAVAVGDFDTTGAGNSFQRIDNNDTNAKADWMTGPEDISTVGALNPGQTPFP